MSNKTRVLFLSNGNACRSQMAEGFAENLAGHLIEPCSAGIAPAQELDARAAKVMSEDWTDISSKAPKALDPALLEQVDMVVTLTEEAREACPALPDGVEHRHWPTADPAQAASDDDAKSMAAYRDAQDEIKENILFLLNDVRGGIDEFEI
ncbi:arsenate reductase ArsC [Halorhodospira halophila]|uniref:Protein tyrosine phosphatase n=1 Tax=Halorhodospira halophila (strain DSM 244 / SL1) TaxID=349124 RepID=A1WV84_HALHL|nr:arsenate reductase ArsC [Halorhodospira halophila]ABM61596.1 protein tyrosine phosphatase [Halorhodospira halophila SL1]MBK1729946.1 arsenate reductase ArsC [Halorhodospira halophila]